MPLVGRGIDQKLGKRKKKTNHMSKVGTRAMRKIKISSLKLSFTITIISSTLPRIKAVGYVKLEEDYDKVNIRIIGFFPSLQRRG